MGIFDIFKKKKSEEEAKPEVEVPVSPSPEEEEDSTPGWDAITEEFERIYPEQTNPKHYGTLIKYMLGGPDPLDGISIYDGGDFWHFVSYGLSELYTKEFEDQEYSGYGLEFTFKLKKTNDEDEIRNVCGILQNLARYIFQTGKVILPKEYVYTRQEEGIDAKQTSKLTGFITDSDNLANTLDTPHGKVEFVTLIGATDAELRTIYESEKSKEMVKELLQKLGTQVTDYDRESLL